ncbi:MAG TPA: haloacid dehalogenase-like hydrolase [Gemmatimonadota bacterium]|nr:haloacid dehalogenase-like hydrolase [Gemmatimonadota bacterium]
MARGHAILFDIDGTLLLTDGAGRVALRSALESVYGTAGPLDGYNFHGKTDPQIVVELMAGAGFAEPEIRQKMATVWPLYLKRLASELDVRRREERIQILPGVRDVLDGLTRRRDVTLGLLTGNIEEGARLKLEAAGMASKFRLGGFGSDAEDRAGVARVAVERLRSYLGDSEGGAPVLVIGDTPEDVACARVVRARAVAVATGRHSVGELEETGADAVFADLSDASQVIDRLLSLLGASGTSAGGAGNGGG